MRAPKKTIRVARRLRRKLTPPEARLWNLLRARLAGQPIFRRQHPIGPYVLDFYWPKANLAIEIDGIAHDMGEQPNRDERRKAWLNKRGIFVLRISAADVMRSTDEAADAIVRLAAARI